MISWSQLFGVFSVPLSIFGSINEILTIVFLVLVPELLTWAWLSSSPVEDAPDENGQHHHTDHNEEEHRGRQKVHVDEGQVLPTEKKPGMLYAPCL